MAGDITTCPYCGITDGHAPERCGMVRAITYRKDGTIKRIEFGPRYQPFVLQSPGLQQPNWFTPIGPSPSAPPPHYPASPNIIPPTPPTYTLGEPSVGAGHETHPVPASLPPRPWERR